MAINTKKHRIPKVVPMAPRMRAVLSFPVPCNTPPVLGEAILVAVVVVVGNVIV